MEMSRIAEKIDNPVETGSKFDLSGYEIVRAQFFSTRLNLAMIISQWKITFNTACMKKFKDVEYVEILLNSVENCIAVRPCEKDNVNAVKWGRIKDGKWLVLPKSCRGFSEPLYELMDWKNECKYRFRGQYFQEDNEQILLFDLEEPEIFKRELQDILSAESTSDIVENETIEIEERQANTVTKTLYPEKWKKHFGNRTDEITVF